ncbi:HAD family hydrolase [Pediococcus pentosaceus]|uniref:hypothetical protein n=1 Tax=Pediococcus pentosaceus TaxID=1255 RepID=UPI003981975A
MQNLQLHYKRYALIAGVLAFISMLVMPLRWGQEVLVVTHNPGVFYGLIGLAGLLVVWTTGQMVVQASRQNKEQTYTTLWLPILGQLCWYGVVVWLYLAPEDSGLLSFMTLPLLLFGLVLLYLTLSWSQGAEHAWPASRPMQVVAQQLTWIAGFLSLYSFLFFGLTVNWQVGLTLATASLLIIDPRWPLIWTAFRRMQVVTRLRRMGLVVTDPEQLLALRDIKNVVTEKAGILTVDNYVIYTASSLDEAYSDFDVLAIMTTLEAALGGPLADAVQDYARDYGVYPGEAQDVIPMLSVGVQGEVLGQRFKLVSASYAMDQKYQVDQRRLDAIIALGDSVSLLVLDQKVIGALSFSASIHRSLMRFDNFFNQHDMQLRLATTDTTGSVQKLMEMMTTLADVRAGLNPDQKHQQQATWLSEAPSLLLTNQYKAAELKPTVTVAVGNNVSQADIVIKSLANLGDLYGAANDLYRIDHQTLRLWQIILIIMVLITAGLQALIATFWLTPILAVIIRALVTWWIKQSTRWQTKHR